MIKTTLITASTFALLTITLPIFATPTSQVEQDQIAQNCRPYLLQYGSESTLPKHVAQDAAPILSRCVLENSCTNSNLNDISDCGFKLSNLSLAAIVANAPTEQAPPQEQSIQQGNQQAAPMPAQSYEATPTEAAPSQKTIERKQPKKQKQQPKINWF